MAKAMMNRADVIIPPCTSRIVARKRSWLVPSGASFHSCEALTAAVMASVGVRYAKDPPCACAKHQHPPLVISR